MLDRSGRSSEPEIDLVLRLLPQLWVYGQDPEQGQQPFWTKGGGGNGGGEGGGGDGGGGTGGGGDGGSRILVVTSGLMV